VSRVTHAGDDGSWRAAKAIGFVVDEIASYARGYSTPHVLFVAHAA